VIRIRKLLSRTSGRRALAAIGVGALVVAGVARCSAADEQIGTDRVLASSLSVDGPDTIAAGTPWRIVVDAELDSVTADVWGPWGVRRLEADVDAGTGIVELPGNLTRHSGRLSAVFTSGTSSASFDVAVVPGPAVDGIVPLAGPRSMVADGSDWTMVSAIAMDRFGNSVADGTPVRLHVRRPDGTIDLVDTVADLLLAGVRVDSGTLAGRSTIRVSVDGATGPEVEVLEVPGPPAVVELLEPGRPLRADGRMLVTIETGRLVDRFGNTLLDGTAASLAMSGPDGAGTLTAVTIDGRAEFVVEAPSRPGRVELAPVVDGVEGTPIELKFVTDIAAVPVEIRRVTDTEGSQYVIDVGPVVTELGGFVPDGTEVVVYGGSEPVSGELRDGVARLVVDAAEGDVFAVDVLGARTEVSAP
jgi:hypothetical protein